MFLSEAQVLLLLFWFFFCWLINYLNSCICKRVVLWSYRESAQVALAARSDTAEVLSLLDREEKELEAVEKSAVSKEVAILPCEETPEEECFFECIPEEECLAVGNSPQQTMSGEYLDQTSQIREDWETGKLWSPSQLVAALRANAARMAKPVLDSEDGRVGTPGAQFSKDMVFAARSSPLLRGIRTLVRRGSVLDRDNILVSVEETTKAELVVYPGYCDPAAVQGAEADAFPLSKRDRATASVAAYNELPSISEARLRKLLEKDFKSGGVVAMDISVQSHIGQKTPIVAFCSILDSSTNDFAESMQVAWYMNLAEGTCKILSVPLVNFPLSRELDLVDSYLKRLYLATYIYNSRGFTKGSAMFSYGIVSFSEYKPTINNVASRVAVEWDSVQKQQLKGERVVSGLNLLTTMQKQHDIDIPDIPATDWVCRAPRTAKPIIEIGSSGLKMPDFTSLRGGSFRAPPVPFGFTQGRRSTSSVVREWKPHECCNANCKACGKDGPPAYVDPSYQPCQACGNGPELFAADDPYLLDGSMPNHSTYVQHGIAERAPIYGLFPRFADKTLEGPLQLRTHIADVEISNLRAGYVIQTWSVASILNSNEPQGEFNKFQAILRYIRAGQLRVYIKVTSCLPISVVGLLKLSYTMRSGAVVQQGSHLKSVTLLPGIVFDGTRDTSAKIIVQVPSCHSIAPTSDFYHDLGTMFLACLTDYTSSAVLRSSFEIEVGIESGASLYENAYGNTMCMLGLTPPENVYVASQMLNISLDTTSPSFTQWRMPIIPSITFSEGNEYHPGLNASLFEHFGGWKGKCLFRFYAIAPALATGTFLVSFLPSANIENRKIPVSMLKAIGTGSNAFPSIELDLRTSNHAYFHVDFRDWKGFYPTGSGVEAHKPGKCRDFPWAVVTQTSRLTSNDRTYNKFRLYLELVEITECQFIGGTWVSPSRVLLPPMALGNAPQAMNCWFSAACLSRWRKDSYWVIPVGPQISQFVTFQGYDGANTKNCFMRHRASETAFWSGTIHYRFRTLDHLPCWAVYTSNPTLFHISSMFKEKRDVDILSGSTQVFTMEYNNQTCLEVTVPMNECFDRFSNQVPSSEEQVRFSYNGFIYFALPDFHNGCEIYLDVKLGEDFSFQGYSLGSSITLVEPVNIPVFK
uniref:Polyprotein n=1 Tax=Corymbium villosum cheravirus TaxID=3115783 RepID=A0AAT9JB49_9SECO